MRILLYLHTNLLVVLTISLLLSLLTAAGNSGPMPAPRGSPAPSRCRRPCGGSARPVA